MPQLPDQHANDIAALMQFRASLATYVEEAAELLDRCLVDHQQGSLFAESASATVGTLCRAQHRPIVLGHLHLFSGLDHLRAAADTLRGTTSVLETPPANIPQYACFTLFRSCLESSSRACWLLDPDLPPTTRASRGMVEWAYSLQEAAKLKPTGFDRDARIQRLVNEAGQVGVRPCEPLAKYPRFGTERRPASTSLTGLQLQAIGAQKDDDGFLFRLLSGMTHSTAYALVVGVTQTQKVGDVLAAQKEPDATWIVVSGVQIARVHQRALAWLGAHSGIEGAPEAPPLP